MKALNLVSILLAITLQYALAMAQPGPPDSLWSRTYGGAGDDVCFAAEKTMGGGYILAGITSSFAAERCDLWLVKMDANGNPLWTRTIGGTYNEAAFSVQQTSDTGYVAAGYTTSYGDGYDFYLVKTNDSGDTLWTRNYSAFDLGVAYSVRQTTDGGYIMGGFGCSIFGQFTALWVVKTDAQGERLWTSSPGWPGYGSSGRVESVQLTSDGEYILAAWLIPAWGRDSAFRLVKMSSGGSERWTRIFGGSHMDRAKAVEETTDRGFIVVGYTYASGAGGADFFLVKTDMAGHLLWSRTYGGANDDLAYSVHQTMDGGYIMAGETNSFGAGNRDFYLVRTDGSGNPLWTRTLGGSRDEEARSVLQTSDGGYVVAGYTSSFGIGGKDLWLVKTGPELDAQPIDISLPMQYALHPNWPNPFNPSTRIAYDLPKTVYVTLTVFDLLGRQVETIVNDMQTAGNHTTILDGSHLPSGIYFCRMQAGDFVDAKKMVLLK